MRLFDARLKYISKHITIVEERSPHAGYIYIGYPDSAILAGTSGEYAEKLEAFWPSANQGSTLSAKEAGARTPYAFSDYCGTK
jgi:hypothetical protein